VIDARSRNYAKYGARALVVAFLALILCASKFWVTGAQEPTSLACPAQSISATATVGSLS